MPVQIEKTERLSECNHSSLKHGSDQGGKKKVWSRSFKQLPRQYTDCGNWVRDYKASLDLRGSGKRGAASHECLMAPTRLQAPATVPPRFISHIGLLFACKSLCRLAVSPSVRNSCSTWDLTKPNRCDMNLECHIPEEEKKDDAMARQK